MAKRKITKFTPPDSGLWRRVVVFPIRVYQKIISPLFPRRCRYYPSCSEYFCQAILRHGIVRGSIFGVGRILRCWNWFAAGDDPVPSLGNMGGLVAAWRKFYRGPGKS